MVSIPRSSSQRESSRCPDQKTPDWAGDSCPLPSLVLLSSGLQDVSLCSFLFVAGMEQASPDHSLISFHLGYPVSVFFFSKTTKDLKSADHNIVSYCMFLSVSPSCHDKCTVFILYFHCKKMFCIVSHHQSYVNKLRLLFSGLGFMGKNGSKPICCEIPTGLMSSNCSSR